MINEQKRFTRAVRVELAKPIGFSWDELGRILRELRGIAHRAMNGALLAVHLSASAKKKGAKGKPLQTVAYQGAGAELEAFQGWAKKHRDPQVQRLANTPVTGGMQSAWASHAYEEWRRFAKSNGDAGFPVHRKGQPIMVRKQEWGLELDDGGLVISVALDATAEHRVGRRRIAVRPGQGAQWSLLRELASGEGDARLGDLKIVYDDRARRKDGSRGKWYALIAYSRPVPAKVDTLDPGKALVVHRGAYNAITVIGTDGFFCKLCSGAKLASQKARLKARRRSVQNALKRGEIGAGARGHGTKRREKALTDIGDKEARVVKTFLQQNASAVRKLCLRRGYGRVVIGAYGGVQPNEDRAIRQHVPHWPLYETKVAIVNALQSLGIQPDECDESYVSQTCPACGHVDARSANRHRGIFHCTNPECLLDRELDWVSAMHMLRRCGADTSEWDRRLKIAAQLERAAERKKREHDPSGTPQKEEGEADE